MTYHRLRYAIYQFYLFTALGVVFCILLALFTIPFTDNTDFSWSIVSGVIVFVMPIFLTIGSARSVWITMRIVRFTRYEKKKFGKLPEYSSSEFWAAMREFETD